MAVATWNPLQEPPAGRGAPALALLGAALAHTLLLGLVFWQPDDTGARAEGEGGLAIGLGPAGGAPGTAAAVPPPAAESLAPPPDAAMVEPAPLPTAPPMPEARNAALAPVAASNPSPAAAPRPVKIAPAEKVEATQADMPAAPRNARPAPVPPPAPAAPRPEVLRATEPAAAAPEPSPPPRARPPAKGEVTAESQTVSSPAKAGTAGRGGTQRSRSAGSGMGSTGGGNPAARADFAARVAAWLARHKHYPRAARHRRIEGAGTIWFRMDGAGHVIAYRITKSAGHPLLDAAMADTLRRAQPLPRIPVEMGRAQLEFKVPMQFLLR
ncbi:energy transducer TonB [Maritimibacter sp. 55A14]|uniref:energy transducer TonB family protein n=1 Tax=Maritimibacter sp. 55A14 TaxID=2174844 RepID=UPI0011B26000|nr:energy transducer TonB [Maritimibacter sp. 55A14]